MLDGTGAFGKEAKTKEIEAGMEDGSKEGDTKERTGKSTQAKMKELSRG